MLLPIGHEKTTVTRLPIVTGILIVVNILIYVLTMGPIADQSTKSNMVTVRTHILILKARYGDLTVTPEVQAMVDEFRKAKPEVWTWLTANDRRPEDAWEAALLMDPDPRPDRLQAQMDDLCAQFTKFSSSDDSILGKYAYHSYKPSPVSYVTHQYLHGSWLHLLGNMWSLYLCGVILEDVWGPFVVLAFYTIAGAFAAFFHGLLTPNSVIPMIGASGAIAGLMGALLIRFPKLNIRMWYFWLFRFRAGTFLAPVYVLIPLWFVIELFYGLMGESGVAHWAHVGGFIFGLVVGVAFYAVKLEEKVINKEAEAQAWEPDHEYLDALDALEQQRDPSACIEIMRNYLKKNPNSLEGWQLIMRAQDWKGDHEAERTQTLPALIRLSLAAGDNTAASQYIEQYRNLGGAQLPATTWLELARKCEKDQQWEAAANEYEQLGQAYYTTDRISLTALMSSARIYLSKLNRTQDAYRLYTAAQNSPIPHLDMDGLIQQGLKQCTAPPAALARDTANA